MAISPAPGATALTPVPFHGATLLTILVNGVPYVALKAICDAIGISADAQIQRIKGHPVLSTCTFVTNVQLPGDTQTREVVCLPLDKLNGWLFGVTVSRTRPEIRERLIAYQRECFDVLAGHFMPERGGNTTARQIQGDNTPLQVLGADQHKLIQTAVLNGVCAATMVQQRVTQAVLKGGDDWGRERWLVAFTTDSKIGNTPFVHRLAPDTLVLTKRELVDLMANIATDAWNTMSNKANAQPGATA